MVSLSLMACGGGGGHSVDAPPPVDASPDAYMPTGGNAMSHTLFVNTEGVTLTMGADDATANKSSLLANATPVTLKPWHMGDAARATKIAAVIAQFKSTLAPYGVAIVDARPAAGPYDMLIVTDDNSAALGSAFSGIGSITPTSCNMTRSVISLTFPTIFAGSTDAQFQNIVVNLGIAMFGLSAGIPISKLRGDCMCLAASPDCNSPGGQACTIGTAGTTIDTGNSGAGTCGVTDATMDEGARFLAAFGPH